MASRQKHAKANRKAGKRLVLILGVGLSMQAFCGGSGEKPMALDDCKFCYLGSRTRSMLANRRE